MKILFSAILLSSSLFSSQLALDAFKQKDYKKAYTLYLQEANNGDLKAKSALSYLYFNALGVEKNSSKALKYLTQAADGNYTTAQYDLGMIYLLGEDDIKTDKQKAFKWLSRAADLNHTQAKYNLALMYYQGEGTQIDVKKSAELLESAAKDGDKQSQKIVGKIYMQLLKFKKAKPWLELNAKNGDEDAKHLLEVVDKEIN